MKGKVFDVEPDVWARLVVRSANDLIDILRCQIVWKQAFLKRQSANKLGTFWMRITRKKAGFLGMFPKYELFDDSGTVLLANAKKMPRNTTSNYMISCEEKVFVKDRDSFIAKLRCNSDRSKYLIFDNGENIERNKCASIEQIRCELGFIGYFMNEAQINGTRSIKVAVR